MVLFTSNTLYTILSILSDTSSIFFPNTPNRCLNRPRPHSAAPAASYTASRDSTRRASQTQPESPDYATVPVSLCTFRPHLLQPDVLHRLLIQLRVRIHREHVDAGELRVRPVAYPGRRLRVLGSAVFTGNTGQTEGRVANARRVEHGGTDRRYRRSQSSSRSSWVSP